MWGDIRDVKSRWKSGGEMAGGVVKYGMESM